MSAEILAFPSGASSDSSGASSDPGPEAADGGRSGAAPVLIGCSHGTSDLTGRDVIRALLDDVRAARPDLDVREAFVDVQQPEVADVVTSVVDPSATEASPGAESSGSSVADGAQPGDAVVVPLLLSAGFHVSVDVAAAVEDRGPGAGRAAASTPLGPDPVSYTHLTLPTTERV